MTHQVAKKYKPSTLEKGIQELWEQENAYEEVKQHCKKGEAFYFIDGPPYTTGHIHLGTAWNKILKDTIIRFRRMQKYNVRDQAGFDMHGLPIEVQVEKKLGIEDKRQIEEMGIDNFVNKCREFAMDHKDKMVDEFKSLGVWLDWDEPYITIKNDYILSEWWTLKKAHEKNLLTQAERVLTWCPRCQTALAEAEVEYWDETDPSIYVRFPLKGSDKESILIWTTTPWTLLANMAIAVNPEFTYAKVKFGKGKKKETMIMIEDKVDDIMTLIDCDDYEVTELMGGSQLTGLEYHHPFLRELKFHQTLLGEWIHKVLLSDTVTPEYTGVVHIAPGHGPEDFEIGKEHDIPPFCPVTEDGKFSEEAGRYANIPLKRGNHIIIQELKRKGLLLFDDDIMHRYGHCWRCKTPIIYRTTDQWFLKVTEIKDDMLEEISEITWYPDWAGSSRMQDWVSNARDWCISRQRYWGTPLPVWRCECGSMKVVESVEDLKEGNNFTPEMDLHRPWIDAVTFTCPECLMDMKRVPDVMDVWFDSAVCAWAQLGFPMQKEEFNKWWPCKWITEAHDQTRGWFYSQLGAGVIAFDEVPYKSVLMHGWALDDQGKRMSKSAGNVIDPKELIEDYGVDALRFYLLKTSAPWDDLTFSYDGIRTSKKTLNILWNVYVFATTYMTLDNFDSTKASFRALRKALRPEDRWLLSRAESLKREVAEAFENYQMHVVCRELESFILDDLSRWYVKLVRDRTWVEGEGKDKLAVYKVLNDVLLYLAHLMAPITPHIAEEIYQNLDGRLTTIFMSDVLDYKEEFVEPDLEAHMDIAREIVERVASARQRGGIKLRWPVKLVVVDASKTDVEDAINELEDIILNQTNAKDLELVPVDSEWGGMDLEVRPNMDVIGPVFRQWASKIAALLEYQSAKRIREGIEKGEYTLGIEGQQVRIMPNMVSFAETLPKGVLQEEFSCGMIYVDTEVTDEIKSEGFSKEIIRRIQEMRKEMDLDVDEKIQTKIVLSDRLYDILEPRKDFIAHETRSDTLDFVSEELTDGYIVEWNAEGENFTIGILSQIALVEEIPEEEIVPEEELPPPEEEQLCGICSKPMRFVNKYQRWYCSICKKYAAKDEMEEAEEPVGEEDMVFLCPNCGADLPVNAIECDKCGASFVEAPPSEEEVEEAPGIEEAEGEYLEAGEGITDITIANLKWGGLHLIKSEYAESAYKLIEEAIEGGYSAICFTRDFPKKLRETYKFGDTKIFWLSNIGKAETIRPKNLEKLSLSMEQFLSKDQTGVILLSGIDYLITNNNFITVLRLIQSLRDQVAVSNSILIIPVNPSVLEESQLKLLEREVDVIL